MPIPRGIVAPGEGAANALSVGSFFGPAVIGTFGDPQARGEEADGAIGFDEGKENAPQGKTPLTPPGLVGAVMAPGMAEHERSPRRVGLGGDQPARCGKAARLVRPGRPTTLGIG